MSVGDEEEDLDNFYENPDEVNNPKSKPPPLDDSLQNVLIEVATKDPKTFKLKIKELIKDPDNKNVFENLLNLTNDKSKDSSQNIDYPTFLQLFGGSLKEELISKIFDCIDSTGNGKITKGDISKFLSKHARRASTQYNAKWLYKALKAMKLGDKTNDKEIDFNELKDHFERENIGEDVAKFVFDIIDANKDNKITVNEFYTWRDKFSRAELNELSTKIDTLIVHGFEELLEDSDGFENIESPNDDGKFDDFQHIVTDNEALLDELINALGIKMEDIKAENKEKALNILKVKRPGASNVVTGFESELAKKRPSINTHRKNIAKELGFEDQKEDANAQELKNIVERLKKELNESQEQTKHLKRKSDALTSITGNLREILLEDEEDIDENDVDGLKDVIGKLTDKVAKQRMEEDEKRKLQYQLADSKLREIQLQEKQKIIEQEALRYYTLLEDQKKLTDALEKQQNAINFDKKRLEFQLSQKGIETKKFALEREKLQYSLAEEKLQLLELENERKKEEFEKKKLELILAQKEDKEKQTLSDQKKMQYNLAEERLKKLELQEKERKKEFDKKKLELQIAIKEDKTKLEKKKMQFELAEEKLKKLEYEEYVRKQEFEKKKLKLQLAKKEDEQRQNLDEQKKIQFKLADEKLRKLELENIEKQKEFEKKKLELQLAIKNDTDRLEKKRLQFELADEKLKKLELEEENRQNEFDKKRLELILAKKEDEQKRHNDEKRRIQYELADEKLKKLELENKEKKKEFENKKLELLLAQKEDEIKKYNNEIVLSNDDLDEDVQNIEDVDRLKNMINSLKAELKEARFNSIEASKTSQNLKEISDKIRGELFEEKRKSSLMMKDWAKNENDEMLDGYDEDVHTKLHHERKKSEKLKNDFDQLQYQLADEKMDKINKAEELNEKLNHERKKSEQLKDELDKLQYQFADEKLEKMTKEEELQKLQYQLAEAKLEMIQKEDDERFSSISEQAKNLKTQLQELKTFLEDEDSDLLNNDEEKINELKKEAQRLKFELAEERLQKFENQLNKDIKNYNENNNNDLQNTINELKAELEEEKFRSSQLAQRLSQAESMQVNKLLQYTANNVKEKPPPPPLTHDTEKRIDELKFQLAEERLKNVSLRKRRASIAGPIKEQLSKIWTNPLITIQMVSEFIERLPDKHKEKIWNRHCKGDFIPHYRMLQTLHSFVALCIKLKDRSVTAPQKHELETSLKPYIEHIKSKTQTEDGITFNEFRKNFADWLLEPVSGLILTSEEELEWKSKVEDLEKRLIEVNREKIRLKRQSRADLNTVLDKINDNEVFNNNENNLQDKTNDELIDIIANLQTKIKILNSQIEEFENEDDNFYKNKEKELENEIKKHEKTKSQMEELENELKTIKSLQTKRRDSQENIDYDNDKTKDFQEEKIEYRINDVNITKDPYINSLKKKVQKAQADLEYALESKKKIEREKSDSVAATTKWKQVAQELQLEISKVKSENIEEKYQEQIDKLKDELNVFKEKHQDSEHVRQQSVNKLHSSMFTKILEAETNHEQIIDDYDQKFKELTSRNEELENTIQDLISNKMSVIQSLAATIEALRTNVTFLSGQVSTLTNNENKLKSKIQTLKEQRNNSQWFFMK